MPSAPGFPVKIPIHWCGSYHLGDPGQAAGTEAPPMKPPSNPGLSPPLLRALAPPPSADWLSCQLRTAQQRPGEADFVPQNGLCCVRKPGARLGVPKAGSPEGWRALPTTRATARAGAGLAPECHVGAGIRSSGCGGLRGLGRKVDACGCSGRGQRTCRSSVAGEGGPRCRRLLAGAR